MASAELEVTRLLQAVTAPALPDIDVVLEAAGGWAGVLEMGSIEARCRVLAELIDQVKPICPGHGIWFGKLALTPLGESLAVLAKATQTAA